MQGGGLAYYLVEPFFPKMEEPGLIVGVDTHAHKRGPLLLVHVNSSDASQQVGANARILPNALMSELSEYSQQVGANARVGGWASRALVRQVVGKCWCLKRPQVQILPSCPTKPALSREPDMMFK